MINFSTLRKFLALSALIFLGSCYSSHIYNPSLDLASKPLEKGELMLSGRYGYAPEARAAEVNKELSPMGMAAVRYGITERIGVGVEGWTDFSNGDLFQRGGYAFSLPVVLKKSDNITWQLIPKYGFVLAGSLFPADASFLERTQVYGHGFSVAGVGYVHSENDFHPYFGGTVLYGFDDFKFQKTHHQTSGEWRQPFGWAVMLHGGLSYSVNDWLNLNAELPLVFQYSVFDRHSSIAPSPSVGFNVVF